VLKFMDSYRIFQT